MWSLPDDGWGFQGARPPRPDIDRDLRLAYEVADALLADDRTRRLRVTVEVQHGVVLLGGTVHDQHTAEVATAVVRQVPGVRDVCNALRTRVTAAPEADGGALATSGQRESEAFDEIVASLRDDSSGPSAGPSRRLPGRTQLLLVALVLLPLAWLVLTLGWPGLLIACGVGAAMVKMNARHRRKSRK
jgi:hypothetical protein